MSKMKDILWNSKYYKVFADYEEVPESDFYESDIDFLRKNVSASSEKRQNPLVELSGGKVKIMFVGELITPNAHYVSVPKNFPITEENVGLTIRMINKYKDLKKDGTSLMSNFSFSYSKEGIKSDMFFYKKLKEFFLDYITYEFIYPKKRKQVHSPRPISNSKIDIVKTEMDFGRKGPGITYLVKDTKNSEKWNLDDIYLTTLLSLMDEFGSDSDRKKIENMLIFIKEQGYEVKNIEIEEDVIDQIKSCDIGIKHYPIANALISYYEGKKLSDRYTVKAFYTKNFEYVWEYFSRIVFRYSDSFKREVLSEGIEKLTIKDFSGEVVEHDDIRPDVFSDFDGHRFVGDCKYYRNLEGDFYKEMYEYNIALGDKYPMAIFVPSSVTKMAYRRRRSIHELYIIKISIEEVIEDAMNGTDFVIRSVHEILKDSNRWKKA